MKHSRRDFRIPVRLGATVHFDWGGSAPALVSDVCRSGLSFTVLRRELPQGAPLGGLGHANVVRVQFEVDGRPVIAIGRIAWVRMTATPNRLDRVAAGVAIHVAADGRRPFLEWLQRAMRAITTVAQAALSGSWESAAAGLASLGWHRADPGLALMALRYAAANRVS